MARACLCDTRPCLDAEAICPRPSVAQADHRLGWIILSLSPSIRTDLAFRVVVVDVSHHPVRSAIPAFEVSFHAADSAKVGT